MGLEATRKKTRTETEQSSETFIDFDRITLKNDFMFCTVMRKEAFCKPFLEMILGIKIERLVYQEKQVTIDLSRTAKSIRLDVYAADGVGTVYNVELQLTRHKNLPKRGRYYQDMIDLNLLDKGWRYQKLPRSVVIFVCDFDMYNRNRVVYSFRRREDSEPELLYGDETQMVFVNLGGNLEGESEELRAFVQYMNSGEIRTEYVQSLEQEVAIVRSDEKWRRDMRTLQEALDEKYSEGIAKGKEEGRTEGIEQGAEQTIRRTQAVYGRLMQAGREAEIPAVIGELARYCEEFGIE